MNVKSAWRAGFTGKGILVAVVDDGVKMDHPNLMSNFVSFHTAFVTTSFLRKARNLVTETELVFLIAHFRSLSVFFRSKLIHLKIPTL